MVGSITCPVRARDAHLHPPVTLLRYVEPGCFLARRAATLEEQRALCARCDGDFACDVLRAYPRYGGRIAAAGYQPSLRPVTDMSRFTVHGCSRAESDDEHARARVLGGASTFA